MSIFAGLGLSDKTTHVCVVEAHCAVLRRDAVATDPDVSAKRMGKHCPNVQRSCRRQVRYLRSCITALSSAMYPLYICARHIK